jgi:hypothetical protein
VLHARFLANEQQTCHATISQEKLEEVETITYVAPEKMKTDEQRTARLHRELEDARHKSKAATLAELAEKDPSQAPKVKAYEKRVAEKAAMVEVEKRLACEGTLKHGSHHSAGIYDDAMRLAVRRFQQKNMIYESNYLRSKTMDALARPPLANDHMAFMRVLRERVVSAAGVVEDGSTDTKSGPATYNNKMGNAVPLRNLADELTQSAALQLGLATAEGVLAFFKRHPASDFRRLRVAVKLPALPEYYGPDMDLSIVIDRGDVWYDLPWDASGVRHAQPRKRYPSFHLYLKYNNQRILLARWRTTVGGWRAEQASDGYEYFRYKGSDVGPRVIRNIVAGPVWIAPESTPPQDQGREQYLAARGQLRRTRAGLFVGLRSRRGLLRRAWQERQARLGQWNSRPRLVGLLVHLQLGGILARLPPPAQPSGHPNVFVHPAPPAHAHPRRSGHGLRTPVPRRRRCLRAPSAFARVFLSA